MKPSVLFVAYVLLLAGCASPAEQDRQARASIETQLAEWDKRRGPNPRVEHVRQRDAAQRQARAEAYAAVHTNATPALLKDFAEGRIVVGMDAAQVLVVMGTPWGKNTSGGVGGSLDQWIYLDEWAGELEERIYLYLKDDRLVRWQELR